MRKLITSVFEAKKREVKQQKPIYLKITIPNREYQDADFYRAVSGIVVFEEIRDGQIDAYELPELEKICTELGKLLEEYNLAKAEYLQNKIKKCILETNTINIQTMAPNTPAENGDENLPDIKALRKQFDKITSLSRFTILNTLAQDAKQYGSKYFYKECIKKLHSAFAHQRPSDITAALQYASEEYEKEKRRGGVHYSPVSLTTSTSQKAQEILADNTNEDVGKIQLESELRRTIEKIISSFRAIRFSLSDDDQNAYLNKISDYCKSRRITDHSTHDQINWLNIGLMPYGDLRVIEYNEFNIQNDPIKKLSPEVLKSDIDLLRNLAKHYEGKISKNQEEPVMVGNKENEEMPAIVNPEVTGDASSKNTKRTHSDKNTPKKNVVNLHKRKSQENQENEALQKCIDETQQKTTQILELGRQLSQIQAEKEILTRENEVLRQQLVQQRTRKETFQEKPHEQTPEESPDQFAVFEKRFAILAKNFQILKQMIELYIQKRNDGEGQVGVSGGEKKKQNKEHPTGGSGNTPNDPPLEDPSHLENNPENPPKGPKTNFSNIRDLYIELSMASKPSDSPQQAALKRVHPDFQKIYIAEIKNLLLRIQKLYNTKKTSSDSSEDIDAEFHEIQTHFAGLRQAVLYAYHTGAKHATQQSHLASEASATKVADTSYTPHNSYEKTCFLLIDIEDMKKKFTSFWTPHKDVIKFLTTELKELSEKAIHMLQTGDYTEYDNIQKERIDLQRSFEQKLIQPQTAEHVKFTTDNPIPTQKEQEKQVEALTGDEKKLRNYQKKILQSDIKYWQKNLGRWLFEYQKKYHNRPEYQNLEFYVKLSIPDSVVGLQQRRRDLLNAFEQASQSDSVRGDMQKLVKHTNKRKQKTDDDLQYVERYFARKALPRLGMVNRGKIWWQGLVMKREVAIGNARRKWGRTVKN